MKNLAPLILTAALLTGCVSSNTTKRSPSFLTTSVAPPVTQLGYLSWDAYPLAVTVQAATDLVHWQNLTNLPAGQTNLVWPVTKPVEFYRLSSP